MYRCAWNVPRIETYLSRIMGGSHFYIQIVIFFFWYFFSFFFFFALEFGGFTATALYVLYLSFLSVCHFPVEGYQFTQQYRKTQHQQPSDVNDSKASHRRCHAKCHVHSMNNIKPPETFSLFSVCYGVRFRAARVFGSSGLLRDEIKTKRLYFTQKSELCLFLCKRTQKAITEFGIYIYIYLSVFP